MNTIKICLSVLIVFFANHEIAQSSSANRFPIINVHLHATTEDSNTVERELEEMDKYNIVLAILSGADRDLSSKWKASAPDKFMIGPSFPCADGMYPRMYPCFQKGNGWPDIQWLQGEFKNGRMSTMGELLYVYYGILPTDERLAPYFSLAEKLSIPVGVHAASGPPALGRLPGCCPNFDSQMGNPLLLKSVLEKHPGLRIWLMHGGEIDFHQQAIEVMKTYPNVYADMSILNSVMPAELHAKLLKSFIDSGLEDRIMFGSDNVAVGPIIKRLESFGFLSDMQRRKILYENAAHFFRLSKKTMAKHHSKN